MPGFRKRFSADGSSGVTYLGPLRIGAFDVAPAKQAGAVELRYRAWPVVDLLESAPTGAVRSIPGTGMFAAAGRRVRFCRFRLERRTC